MNLRNTLAAAALLLASTLGHLPLQVAIAADRTQSLVGPEISVLKGGAKKATAPIKLSDDDLDDLMPEHIDAHYVSMVNQETQLARASEAVARAEKELQLHLWRPGADLGIPLRPVVVTSPFGMRWGRMHEGLDLGAPTGQPVLAVADGIVVLSKSVGGYGQLVSVEHGSGLETRYAHCSRRLVRPGQMVKKGQVIALVGSTGRSTGPHLHFEVLANGIARNPAKYIL